MKNRRLWINVLRVVFSALLLVVLYKLIHFEDEYVLPKDRHVPARDVRMEGDGYRVGTEWFPAKDVELREGFVSIFRRMKRTTYLAIAPGFLIVFALLALRWHILLRAHGFPVGFGSVFAVTYMGGFFNNFLPGSVGGDIARALIAARGEERKAALVGTILLDRIVGLAAMVLLAAVCVVPFVRDPAMRRPVVLVGILFVGMVGGYFAYFSRAVRRLPFVNGLKGKGKVGEVLRDLDGTLHILKHRKGTVALCLLLSFLAQSVCILLIFGLALGLRISGVSLVQFFVFEPIIFIATAVPVSAGGWGVQEWTYVQLFGPAGVSRNAAVALSLLYKLTLVFVTVPGGILFALGAARRRRESGTGSQVGGAAGDVPAHR
ncbi:MAG: flippase-like domain-containing protein [Planctomycetes bacterium]|nr:flippase-like domain-containing protein [Planctomycetota bacterium]